MTTREEEEEDLDSTFIHYFRNSSYSTEDPPPSYFQDNRSGAVDLVIEKINMADLKSKPRRPWDWENVKDMDWETSCKKQIARLLVRFEEIWVFFSEDSDNPEYHVREAIRIAATFLLRLCPKNLLYLSSSSITNETTRQLNLLWGKLTASQPASMEKAYEFILKHLAQDTHSYPYIIESHVTDMLCLYSDILKYPTLSPHPFFRDPTPLDRDSEDDHHRFNEILEVVQSINDSTTELKADDYTRMLMQPCMDPDAEYASTKYTLSSKLNIDVQPYDFSEYSSTLNSLFGGLFMKVLRTVRGQVVCAMLTVHSAIYLLDPHEIRKEVPSEIISLIHVAHMRRIALGYRFVNRNHLLWAIYECGLALPSQITDDIEFNAAEDTHPPYHIYLACRNFAEFLSEDLQLEIFIFVVIYSTDSGFTWDKSKMKDMKTRYKKFLEDLEGAQRSPKRRKLVSEEYK